MCERMFLRPRPGPARPRPRSPNIGRKISQQQANQFCTQIAGCRPRPDRAGLGVQNASTGRKQQRLFRQSQVVLWIIFLLKKVFCACVRLVLTVPCLGSLRRLGAPNLRAAAAAAFRAHAGHDHCGGDIGGHPPLRGSVLLLLHFFFSPPFSTFDPFFLSLLLRLRRPHLSAGGG